MTQRQNIPDCFLCCWGWGLKKGQKRQKEVNYCGTWSLLWWENKAMGLVQKLCWLPFHVCLLSIWRVNLFRERSLCPVADLIQLQGASPCTGQMEKVWGKGFGHTARPVLTQLHSRERCPLQRTMQLMTFLTCKTTKSVTHQNLSLKALVIARVQIYLKS